MTPIAAFGSPFRLYRRRGIILPGGNMKSILIAVVASIACISAQAGTIGISYSFTDATFTAPPVMSGTTLTLESRLTGSIFSGNPALNALWNPVALQTHRVVNLTNGLGTGTFKFTFADGDTLTGNFSEDDTVSVATGMGPFTAALTFTGGTGLFADATGSAPGRGVTTPTGFTFSGSGTLTPPGVPQYPSWHRLH